MHSTRPPTGKPVATGDHASKQQIVRNSHRDWRIGKSRDVYSRVLQISMSLTDMLHLVVYGWKFVVIVMLTKWRAACPILARASE